MKERLEDLWWVIDDGVSDVDNYYIKSLMREKYSDMSDSKLANKFLSWSKNRMNEAMEAAEEFEMLVNKHKDADREKMPDKDFKEKYMGYDMIIEIFKKKIKTVSQKISDFKM